jgi:dienelactone hydrolase
LHALLLLAFAQFFHAPATHPRSPYRPEGLNQRPLLSLAKSKSDWQRQRPALLASWKELLGRLEPEGGARRWIGDVRQSRLGRCEKLANYERCELEIPIETDFWQTYLLLRPISGGKHPAVIAWTSTTPDYRKPEEWWGAWLAERGFVVLCGWSFLRNYRDGSTFREGAPEKVHQRFGRWMGVGKMAWDASQEVRYLASRADVDPKRIGFIGFSLGAKGALYAAAFTPGLAAVVSIDPGVPMNGPTNWFAKWYLDWNSDVSMRLLNPDPSTPEFERDHHELLALAAPRPILILGGNATSTPSVDSDDAYTQPYIERAREIYKFHNAADSLSFVITGEGHKADGPKTAALWQVFFTRWLRP